MFSTTHQQIIAVRSNHLAGNRVCVRRLNRLSAPDCKAFQIETRVSVGPGLKSSEAAFNRRRTHRPVNQSVFFIQPRSKSRILIALRPRREIVKTSQSLAEQSGAV